MSEILPASQSTRLPKLFREIQRREIEDLSRGFKPTKLPYNDQESAWHSTVKVLFIGGGNRSGKTELGVQKAIAFCTGRHPTLSKDHPVPVYGRYCGTTYERGIKSVILKKFRQAARKEDLYMHDWNKAWNESSKTLTFNYKGNKKLKGSVIQFLSGQQHIDAYRGDDLDFCIMDEHFQRKYYDENIARLVDRNGWMMLTMTPEAGITWEDEEILKRAMDGDKDYETYRFDSRKNPFLSKEGLAAFIKTLEKFPELFKAKIMGLFTALEGLVYPMFKEKVHVKADFPIPREWFKACIADIHLDKPAAIVWLAWSPEGVCYAYREAEWIPNQGGVADLARLIRVRSAGEHIQDWIMDESMGGSPDEEKVNVYGEKTVITQLNDEGLPFIGTNQAGGKDVEAGVMKVREFLRPNPSSGRCRFYVFESCPLIIKEFLIYQFKRKTIIDEESYRERIRNIIDDWVTCVRYGIASEPMWNLSFGETGTVYDDESGVPIDEGHQGSGPHHHYNDNNKADEPYDMT